MFKASLDLIEDSISTIVESDIKGNNLEFSAPDLLKNLGKDTNTHW
jgi:hypothetical protein